MTLRLAGSTSGYTEIDAPAVAGSNTLVLPTGNGTNGQALITNGSGALSWADAGKLVQDTAQNSTSGTNIDFTGLPTWTKRITMILNGVSTSGTNTLQIVIGTSGGYQTTSYTSTVGAISNVPAASSAALTSGFIVSSMTSTSSVTGVLTVINQTGNVWFYTGTNQRTDTTSLINYVAGGVTLSGVLDRIRLTTVGGTDTFDTGSVNILYEG